MTDQLSHRLLCSMRNGLVVRFIIASTASPHAQGISHEFEYDRNWRNILLRSYSNYWLINCGEAMLALRILTADLFSQRTKLQSRVIRRLVRQVSFSIRPFSAILWNNFFGLRQIRPGWLRYEFCFFIHPIWEMSPICVPCIVVECNRLVIAWNGTMSQL